MPAQVGLDIGSATIRLIGFTGNKLSVIGSILNPTGALTSEAEKDQMAIATSISRLFEELKVKQDKVVLSLGEEFVYSRMIEIPKMSKAEFSSSLKWLAEQYIPVALDQVELKSQILGETAKGTMKVLLVGASKLAIGRLMKIIEKTNLTPMGIETQMMAVARGLNLKKVSDPSLVLNIGGGGSEIGVVKNGVNEAVYAVPVGGQAMTRALATELKMDYWQAEEYKKTYGLDETQMEGKIAKAMMTVVSRILLEVEKAIAAYQGGQGGARIERLYLVGGGAVTKGLGVVLTERLGLEAVLGDPFMALGIKLDKEVAGKSAYTTAVGLAWKKV
jgi:type IV pilus assembly protein PilM